MQGFGAGGTGGMPGTTDFNEAARQYWTAWGDMMRRAGGAAAPAPPPAQPGWSDVAGWWSQMAGNAAPAPKPAAVADGVDELMRRFNAHAGGWFTQMQQLATQFAGRSVEPSEIANAWRQALGGQGANPFADVFAGMSQPGQLGFDGWFKQVAPFLQAMQSMAVPAAQPDMTAWLGLPTFGFTREHQQRVQQLVQAQLDYQQKNNAYAGLMGEAAQQAFSRFEEKLRERSEPGKQIATARALFDLWIDAAEDAYAQMALSPRFREVYGELVNAQMRLRGAVQREVELMGQAVGMPTRTEMDSTHRKIVQLEREMRRLRDALASQGQVQAERAHDNGASASSGTPRQAPQSDAGGKPKPTGKAAAKTDNATANGDVRPQKRKR